MKKVLSTYLPAVLLFILVRSNPVFSQLGSNSSVSSAYLEDNGYATKLTKLKKTTLLVVLDDEQSELGQSVIKSFDTHWKFSKYEFIGIADIEKYRKDENYSIFKFERRDYPMTSGEYGYSIYFKGSLIQYVEVYKNVMGLQNGISTLKNDDFMNIHIKSTLFLGCYILRLQQQMEDAINKVKYAHEKLKVKSDDGNSRIDYYDCEIGSITNKSILIHEEIGDSLSKAVIARSLNMEPGKIFVVTAEEIIKAVDEQSGNILVIYDLNSSNAVAYSVKGKVVFSYMDAAFYKKNPYQKKALKAQREPK